MQIQLTDVEFAYGRAGFRLHVPELLVESGSTVAVVGPSGSGKTTLLHLVAGILAPGRGRVALGETILTELSDAARRAFRIRTVGAVFQEFELLEYLDVLGNILLPYRITPALGLDDAVAARAKELATEVGLGDKLDRRPGRLSHGEKQRVAI